MQGHLGAMARSLRGLAKRVLPQRAREALKSAHRELVFRRAMKRFLASPESCARPGSPVLNDLIYGWGNDTWSALDEYLAGCIRHAAAARGPILECGSGLSTILVGALAQRRGQLHWALEHTPEWATRVRKHLARHKITSVILCTEPLRDYGSFCWYDPPLESMPKSFSLVLCDGPPASTKGGRSGLVPIMGKRLGPGSVLLLDDGGREQERALAKLWEDELGASATLLGETKPYIEMTVTGKKPVPQGVVPAVAARGARGVRRRA